MRFVYTKYGILTEDRARELLEACGDGMDECGYAGDMDDTRMGGFPDSKSPIKVVIVGDDSQLEEADTSSAADGGSVTGTQVALSKPQGPSGAPAPSGASVTKESFNRHAEYLLETWLEEELHGDQDELDIAPPYGKLTRADFKNLQRRKSTHKKD